MTSLCISSILIYARTHFISFCNDGGYFSVLWLRNYSVLPPLTWVEKYNQENHLTWSFDCVYLCFADFPFLFDSLKLGNLFFFIASSKFWVWSTTLDILDILVAPWCSSYHYCTTSFNKAWTQVLHRFKPCSQCVGDSRWWGSLTLAPAGNKVKHLLSVNHTTTTIYHHHHSKLSIMLSTNWLNVGYSYHHFIVHYIFCVQLYQLFFHWDSLNIRLNSHYQAWSYKKKYRNIKTYRKSLYK